MKTQSLVSLALIVVLLLASVAVFAQTNDNANSNCNVSNTVVNIGDGTVTATWLNQWLRPDQTTELWKSMLFSPVQTDVENQSSKRTKITIMDGRITIVFRQSSGAYLAGPSLDSNHPTTSPDVITITGHILEIRGNILAMRMSNRSQNLNGSAIGTSISSIVHVRPLLDSNHPTTPGTIMITGHIFEIRGNILVMGMEHRHPNLSGRIIGTDIFSTVDIRPSGGYIFRSSDGYASAVGYTTVGGSSISYAPNVSGSINLNAPMMQGAGYSGGSVCLPSQRKGYSGNIEGTAQDDFKGGNVSGNAQDDNRNSHTINN